MTENEAIEALKLEGGLKITGRPIRVAKFFEGIDVAIKALKEIQKYRKIEKNLKENYHANVDIPLLMNHFIETVFKGEKHEGFCILTNEDKEAWEEYKAIGTPEECRAAEKKQKAKKMESPWCPCCGKFLTTEYMNKRYHCIYCGQLLEWGGER